MSVHRHYPRNRIPVLETLEAWIILGGAVLAIWLAFNEPFVHDLVSQTVKLGFFASFVMGFFFTSTLTTVPAIVAIMESASHIPAWELAIVGGLGAVCGDLLLFRFVRSRVAEHILRACTSPALMRLGRAVSRGPLWWIVPALGAIVVASPLPDELGIMMMGVSHLRLYQFIPIVFFANASGIFLIALAAM